MPSMSRAAGTLHASALCRAGAFEYRALAASHASTLTTRSTIAASAMTTLSPKSPVAYVTRDDAEKV